MGPPNPLREGLIARVAILLHPQPGVGDVNEAWERGEAYVAALELFPQNTAKCPCCDKSVQLCTKHYQLHEPGKPCCGCREQG